MNTIKEKIPKEIIQFFLQQGTVVSIVEGQKNYTFMPFWLEIIDADNGIVIFHPLGNIPDDLKEYITDKRDET